MTEAETAQPTGREVARSSRLLLTVQEAAGALRVSRSKLYELMARREVRSVRIDGSRRVPVEALEAYVADLLASEEGEGRHVAAS